ncbi:GNAT family N-acetyltransferase [Sphingomonas sp. LaA6.9]|uniref:GNAT family N-acetyltransferase n=1 Tax=Sphingomonas sp. LaA6.9 TaxID=2919914 RepID=UPI001F4FD64B|nr:GNAT family N-acetyltransferase [Sphingomonas sp. LaA6.9]MCJ8159880.1 GNAT family N-acetyltransferase [Sphingomonas sp. LaA6.9]
MSDTISIRLCGAEDAAALSLIGGATFLETFADSIDGPDIIAHCQGPHGVAAYAGYLADPESRCWLAEISETGSPIGYQLLTVPDLPVDIVPGDIELKRIYIFSNYHGGGLARRLMETAIEEARAMGRKRLLLGVYAENPRAIAFYTKMGFEMAGERWFTVGTRDFYDKVMARAL